jgi:Tfp pilus assembly protein PilF
MGASKFNQHPLLNLNYADALKQQKSFTYAESLYRKFLNDPKYKSYALIGICELMADQKKAEELTTQKEILRQHIKANPLNPGEVKLFAKRLEALL